MNRPSRPPKGPASSELGLGFCLILVAPLVLIVIALSVGRSDPSLCYGLSIISGLVGFTCAIVCGVMVSRIAEPGLGGAVMVILTVLGLLTLYACVLGVGCSTVMKMH